jgi:hypothetical protein
MKHGNFNIKLPLMSHILIPLNYLRNVVKGKQGKAIPVTGRGGPYYFETPRLPHFLENWLRDG